MAFPFIDHGGVRIEEIGPGTSRLTLQVQPFHNNSQGVVHGGALFTLADTGMGAALYGVLGPQERASTLEIKINYFRPVHAGTVECRSQVVHADVDSPAVAVKSRVNRCVAAGQRERPAELLLEPSLQFRDPHEELRVLEVTGRR